ncbi:P-type conjugative transfer ATPase TrbB [Glaciimonas sp. GG7]
MTVTEGISDELHERRLESLRYAMGPVMLDYLLRPDVVEIFLNPDGLLWAEEFGKMFVIGEMSPTNAMIFLRQVASSLDQKVWKENAIIEGELLLDGSRFEGIAPPIVDQVAFNIRKKASRVYTLSEYVKHSILPFSIAEMLRDAIAGQDNILVVGGTGSGKTTFCNAILHEMNDICPAARVLLMEDTRELQCSLRNKVPMRSYEFASMQRLLKAIMRLRPDRIVVGEVRGMEALALLKAWNTGHPGGLCTVHANSALKGLYRLDQLISEVSATPQRTLIGEAVQISVFLARTNEGRRVKEVVRIHGYNESTNKYEHEMLYQYAARG